MLWTCFRDFIAEEIHTPVSSLPPGESPGLDGYTAKFYKVLVEDLTTPLITSFNSISGSHHFSPAFLQVHIAVIPKDGKDPQLFPRYRPIFLINMASKLYTKLIAMLNPLLGDFIHPDRVR